MLKKIPFSSAVRLMVVIYILLILNQILILFRIAPFIIDINYWDNGAFLIPMLISLLIFNVLPMLAIQIKGGKLKHFMPLGMVNTVIWIAGVLFIINAVTSLLFFDFHNTLINMPIALISGLLCIRIAQEPIDKLPQNDS